MRNRFKQRRTNLSSLLQYLHNKNDVDASDDLFPILKRQQILQLILSIKNNSTDSNTQLSSNTTEVLKEDLVVEDSSTNITHSLKD